MIIRKARPCDIPAIVDLGLEGIENAPYEGLLVSREKVKDLATECVSSAANFSWVAEVDNTVVAAVSALVHEMMVYERKQATVVQFYTRKAGAGVKLIRELLSWVDSRRGIKMVCFTIDCNADPRIGKLLNRLGLSQELPVYMRVS